MNVIGIKDLLKKAGLTPLILQHKLIHSGVNGSWSTLQNVYNLINGDVVPKDAYVYILLSDLLDVSVNDILMRYTKHKDAPLNSLHWIN